MTTRTITAVMQRPGKRSWILYDAALLKDPTGRKRDPELYLGERCASGDERVEELIGGPVWLPGPAGWAEAGDAPKKRVRWRMNHNGVWAYEVQG